MAKEISRRFDPSAAAVYVTIEDELGTRIVHTVYVFRRDGTQENVEEVVRRSLEEVGARAEKVRLAFHEAGWKG